MRRPRRLFLLVAVLALLLAACRDAVATPVPATPPTAAPTPGRAAVPARPTTAGIVTASAAGATGTDLARRPLHLPALAPGAACPVTAWQPAATLDAADFPASSSSSYFAFGPGPVYPIIYQFDPTSRTVHPSHDQVSGWTFDKVLWLIAPSDREPALVRARRLAPPAILPFFHGRAGAADETALRLPAEGSPATWRTSGSGVHFPDPAPGCYAFQVDGQSFSDVIVVAVSA